MPSKYIRKTSRGSWQPQDMIRAVKAVKNEQIGIRKAAKMFNVPYGTLQDRLKGKRAISTTKGSLGRSATFTPAQEVEILNHIIKMSKMFHGLTPITVRRTAFEFAESNNIKNNFNKDKKCCGKDWLYSFLKRNPTVSLRKPEATSLNRILAFNKVEVKLFYDNLSTEFGKYGFGSHQIFNVDETGITQVHVPSKILAVKGQKQVGAITSGERGKLVTAVCAMSASGIYVPPMFIFGRKRMAESLTRDGPENAIYKCSKNGWINEDLYVEWLHHFVHHVKCSEERRVLLIMDNHSSHSSLAAYQFCRENGISVVTIPPHTSHRLQPLDISFFGPLKTAYNQECDNFMRTKNYEAITQSYIAMLFKKAYYRVATIEKAASGFEKTGIFPLRPDVIAEEEFAPTEEVAVPVVDKDNETVEEATVPFAGPSKCTKTSVNEKTLNEGKSEEVPIAGPSGYKKITKAKMKGEKADEDEESSCESLISFTDIEGTDDEDKSLMMEEQYVSVSEILPLPRLRKTENRRAKSNKKGHSLIFTSTPNKDILVEKTHKKDKRQVSKVDRAKRNLGEEEGEQILKPLKKQKGKDSKSKKSDELCIVCEDVGKDREWWLKCALCEMWAHLECTGLSRKDVFICHICA